MLAAPTLPRYGRMTRARPRVRPPLPPEPEPRRWDDAADENLRVFARAIVDIAIQLRAERREMDRITRTSRDSSGDRPEHGSVRGKNKGEPGGR